MRLTLRTLLAYLDDILEPAQAQEIGRKTAESSFATALTHRIREVLRRRRLTAPELSGPGAGLDPNTVAEYLDNTLPPDGVADVEKVCLDSDVHLAEVAASHQILTLVLGEPVDVIPDSRERMYALGPVGARSSAAVADMAVVDGNGGPANSREAARAVPDVAAASVPDYLKRKPLWKRALPFAAVAALLLIWLGLFAIDNPFNLATTDVNPAQPVQPQAVALAPAVRPENTVPDRAAVDSVTVPPEAPDVEVSQPAAAEAIADSTTVSESDTELATEAAVAEVVPERTEPGNDPFQVADAAGASEAAIDSLLEDLKKATAVDQDETEVAAAAPTTDSLPATPESPAVVRPDGQAAAESPARGAVLPVQYQSQTGILLYKDPIQHEWMVIPRRSMLYPEDVIASPAPFESRLIVDQGLCSVSLLGGTRVRSLGENRAGRFGFELQEGRLLIKSHPAGPPAGEPQTVTMGLAVDDRLWRIEFLTPDTVCGVEVVRRLPDHPNQQFEDIAYGGRLYVVHGTARLADGNGGIQVVSAGNWQSLVPEAEELVSGLSNMSNSPAGGLPDWLNRSLDEESSVDRRNEAAFEDEFVVDQPVRLSIPASVMSPRPSISEFAVKCLALTQNEAALVQALAQADHEEARMAAFLGLRAWLPRQPENREKLVAELEGHFQPESAEIVERLLWGFSADDLKLKEPQPTPSSKLLLWMSHEHPPIREMAFYYVSNLTGLRYNYRPLNPPGQRRSALDRWLTHLEKEGSLLQ